MDKGGPSKPGQGRGPATTLGPKHGPRSRPRRLADHLSFAWQATPSAGRRRPDEESDGIAARQATGICTQEAYPVPGGQITPSGIQALSANEVKAPALLKPNRYQPLAYRCLRTRARAVNASCEFMPQWSSSSIRTGCRRPRTGCPSPTAPSPQESCAPADVAYQAVSAAPARGETRT